MFTGITEALGTVIAIGVAARPDPDVPPSASTARITVTVPWPVAAGESVAINGVCMTCVKNSNESPIADVMPRTLETSTLGRLRRGDQVNLERALLASDRLGGHLVQGHVDGIAVLVGSNPAPDRVELTFETLPRLARYLVNRGSVAIEGVSLTVADCREGVFTVGLIPTTAELTTLGRLRPGDEVNIETDLFARHLERLLVAVPLGTATPAVPRVAG